MFKLLLFCTLLFTTTSYAQVKVDVTDRFIIEGMIDHPVTVSVHTIDSFTSKALGDVATINHKGEVKSVRKNVKGILLKDILSGVKLNVVKPNELFGYYFVLVGSDGYKFVLSYNEVFNEDNVYLVTESYGKKWQLIDDRVAILVQTEKGKGHVAMKGLSKVLVQKVK